MSADAATTAAPLAELDTALAAVLPGTVDALAAARRRVSSVPAEADGGANDVLRYTYAASALCAAPLERQSAPLRLEPLLHALAASSGVPPDAVRLPLFATVLAELAGRGERAQAVVGRVLHLLCALAPAQGASAWLLEPAGGPPLRAAGAAGSHARQTHRLAATAARALLAEPVGGPARAAALRDRGVVLLARPDAGAESRCAAFLELAVGVVGARLEAERGGATSRDETEVAEAAERRLLRLGLDLHDGAAQTIAALASDAGVVRAHLRGVAGVPEPVASFVEDVVERLHELGAEIRDLAESLESRSLVRRPLAETLRRELAGLERRSRITTSFDADSDADGDARALTTSQQTALVRVVQEALANVREHSGAGHVSIRVRRAPGETCVEVVDDGVGFDLATARARGAARGRIGLGGMTERLALLGGRLEIDTRPGGGTTVRAAVPDWRPPAA